MAEDDHGAVAVAHQTREVALGLGDVARRRLRPRRRELPALVALHDVELDRVGEQTAHLEQRQVEALAGLTAEQPRDLGVEARERAVGLVGRVDEGALTAGCEELAGRREAVGEGAQGARLGAPERLVGRLLAAGELPTGELLMHHRAVLLVGLVDLGGGIDVGGFDLRDGALREDGEVTQRLELIAPELETQGVTGRRVHVDDAAAHGEVAALAHLLLAFVAQSREGCHGLVERDLPAGLQVERRRLQRQRQEALEQGDGVGDDDLALLEREQRPLALAHDVRCRRDVCSVEHAARRQRRRLAPQVDAELRRQAHGRLGVGRHDKPARRLDPVEQAGGEVGRERARGVDRLPAAQLGRDLAEAFIGSQVLE